MSYCMSLACHFLKEYFLKQKNENSKVIILYKNDNNMKINNYSPIWILLMFFWLFGRIDT